MAVKSVKKKKTAAPRKSQSNKSAGKVSSGRTTKKAPVKGSGSGKSVKKTSVSEGTTRSRKGKAKRKTNLYKLCSEMNKLCIDAVDKEVVKRFKTLIDTSAEEITKTSLQAVLANPLDSDLSTFHESIQPYVKHYVFMVKRARK